MGRKALSPFPKPLFLTDACWQTCVNFDHQWWPMAASALNIMATLKGQDSHTAGDHRVVQWWFRREKYKAEHGVEGSGDTDKRGKESNHHYCHNATDKWELCNTALNNLCCAVALRVGSKAFQPSVSTPAPPCTSNPGGVQHIIPPPFLAGVNSLWPEWKMQGKICALRWLLCLFPPHHLSFCIKSLSKRIVVFTLILHCQVLEVLRQGGGVKKNKCNKSEN